MSVIGGGSPRRFPACRDDKCPYGYFSLEEPQTQTMTPADVGLTFYHIMTPDEQLAYRRQLEEVSDEPVDTYEYGERTGWHPQTGDTVRLRDWRAVLSMKGAQE